jgi:hypothetical protein
VRSRSALLSSDQMKVGRHSLEGSMNEPLSAAESGNR